MDEATLLGPGQTLESCKVSSKSQSSVLLSHESGWSCWVEDSVPADFGGNTIAVRQLGEGSVVTVILGRGSSVSYIEVTLRLHPNVSNQADSIDNQTCSVCRIDLAMLSCNCQTSPVLLCSQCLPKHQVADPLIPHAIIPLAARGQDLEEYQRKFNYLKERTAELRRNLKTVEKAEQELTAVVDRAIDSLKQYKETWLGKLGAEKAQLMTVIDAAVREAQSCLAQRTSATSNIAELLLSSSSEKLEIVTYCVYPPKFTNLLKYENKLVCDKCHAFHVWPVRLDCGHYICKGCFIAKAEEIRTNQGCIFSTPEHKTSLICPILDCRDPREVRDPAKVSDKQLQLLLGEKLEAYILEAEPIIGTRKCSRCTYYSQLDKFIQFPICGCRLCVYCEIEMLQSGNQVCLCGYYFDQRALEDVFTMREHCSGCRKYCNLVKGFPHFRCCEHILCFKCFEIMLEDPSPRCPACHRLFLPQKIAAAKQKMTRQCELHCGRTLGSVEALALDCDCHYCENCAFQVIQARIASGQDIWKCSICDSSFPKTLIDKFVEWLLQAGYTFEDS